MTESLCSCCKLLGKPPGRINFIITTGSPVSLVYQRIKYLLKNYAEISSCTNDIHLAKYEILMNINDQLFIDQNQSSSTDQSISTLTPTCCNGLNSMSIGITDASNSSQVDEFRKNILELLNPTTEEQEIKHKSASWILLSGSVCLEPAFMNIFLQLNDSNSSLLKFTLKILCFLVNEQQLFESWIFQSQSIQDYQTKTYPVYDHRIKSFFSLLNSSKYLQNNTLLIDEQTVSIDNALETLMQCLFNESSKYLANNNKLRSDMAKLLSPHRRTARDVRDVRNNLQKCYHGVIGNRLKPLLNDLQQVDTAANAARKIVHLVLDELGRINDEELRAYKKQLILGLDPNDIKHANTIAAQLIHYALQLLKNPNDTLTPLIYSIVLVICMLGSHFFFRHDLFNYTPEIYSLSLLLINQRQYALTLSGLRLCSTILNGDQSEHKYAIAYLTHDPLVARKIFDAIKWLLSPYQTLKNLWTEEDEKEQEDSDSESIEEEPKLHIFERVCFRHTGILLERSFIRTLASLFYGSADHCAQVTEDDVHNLAEVIEVLADVRMIRWSNGEKKSRYTPMLISELCALLSPILLYSSPAVNLALVNEDNLLLTVPKAIHYLLKMKSIDQDTIDACICFYTQFVQSKFKRNELVIDIQDEEKNEQLDTKTIEQSIDSFVPLQISKDLIVSYYNLYRQIQETSLSEEKSAQQNQIQILFDEEWKKFNIQQLEHNYKQVENEKKSLNEELTKLRHELQRTQSERDQFRKDNIQMAQEIDNLKLRPIISNIEKSQQLSAVVSTATTTTNNNNDQNNIIDELQKLSPNEITKEQAEKCIREIFHRRTTFNDNDMRKSICGSLKNLGSDLYSSSVHFLHELIQNAEDNFYDNSMIPCLRIELNHNYILLSNNEQGLRAKDVLAICSLAVTTKTNLQKHIGEKGVGFKSVFVASNQPMLISHAWKFCFQVPGIDAMSYITPLWITDQDIPECIAEQVSTYAQYTHLYLPLKLETQTSEANLFLDQVIKAVDPCVLLNMRQLKRLEIIDKRQNKETLIEKQCIGSTALKEQSNVTFEDFTFFNLTGSIMQLHTSTGYNTFRVYTCYIDIPNSIKQQQQRSSNTRLILAFPCEKDYDLTSTVYTGLPVCDLGFNFLFNADFQLVTNRENVRENVPSNTFIRDHLSALFVYILLNDIDLRKDINRYCPTSNIYQGKHSSWWLIMIDNINLLIKKYISILFDIRTDKIIRYFNKDLSLLVSNEQLYNCADIHVIDSNTSFLTFEHLKSFQIQSVSIIDVLNCFPNREETTTTTNDFRQQFRLWTQNQDEQWWSQLFHHLTEMMTPEISQIFLQKPIFLLQNHHHNHHRQYLPINDTTDKLLFISDNPQFRMWKTQLTLLRYSSKSESIALIKSKHVQLLTEERMIEIIYQNHLQLAVSPLVSNPNVQLIEEIWQDLFYLKSHLDKLNKSTLFLVPVTGTSNLIPIQNAILPSILGVDIRQYIDPINSSIICFPYCNTHYDQLFDILQWEYFLLEMNCQRPSIHLPLNYSIINLPLLPTLTKFTDEKCVQLGEFIFSYQTENTKECLRQFPIIYNSNIEQQIIPVSAIFDEMIVPNLPSLPHITIPHHCRALAKSLGICTEYNLLACVKILKLLSNEQNKNVDLYVQWLSHLQLYVRQQHTELNMKTLLSSFQLYLPDDKNFYLLKNLLIKSDNEEHDRGILLISKYLELKLISPLNNQIYWQFKDLFYLLGCLSTSTISITNIYDAIYLASHDKSNFISFGDCKTTLSDYGTEIMMTLYQYLEDLIWKYVKNNVPNSDLYNTIIINKHATAPYGSREDLEWRFSFTCNSLSQQLEKLIGIESQRKRIGLIMIDRKIVIKKIDTIIYACLETMLIQNLSKDIGKRHFILPLITRTCPLVLAAFGIDYIERRGKIQWIHQNHNLEYLLKQLTEIFCHTLNDPKLEVVTAKYASVSILLSDSFVIDSINEEYTNEIHRCMIATDYPFWIFNKTILLCTGNERGDASKAIIATSALTTLLHKRNHKSFEEAKSIAQKQISTCTAFRSDYLSSVASTESNIYSFTDILFPTNHHSIESMIISIGKYCTIEEDPEKITIDSIAVDRIADDIIYRSRIKIQNNIPRNMNLTNIWKDPSIVDGIEQIRIGQNAEHFFFVYLQNHYGSVDVTPIKNWRSSSRLIIYPQYRDNINDSAGFDFELQDTHQVFIRTSKSTTKYCYFEVKGTSGSFNEEHTRFNISQNELDVCRSIVNDRRRQEREAYFIIIIENCLDAEKISLAAAINW
ncbi:unnamed protein product [Rotaria sp. Silwood1]|nr:unnamed protein product [Rotaria sp. Silwood1]